MKKRSILKLRNRNLLKRWIFVLLGVALIITLTILLTPSVEGASIDMNPEPAMSFTIDIDGLTYDVYVADGVLQRLELSNNNPKYFTSMDEVRGLVCNDNAYGLGFRFIFWYLLRV